MQRRVAFSLVGVAVLAVVAAVVIVLGRADESRSSRNSTGSGGGATHGRDAHATGGSELPPPAFANSGLDPLVEEFRATERSALQRYNTALREHRENRIDELELSNIIESDVLQPWRALRARVTAAPQQDALYTTLRRYLEARQISWEAYVAALRAPSDDAARPHYEAHRERNADAQEHAKELGRMFREAGVKANAAEREDASAAPAP